MANPDLDTVIRRRAALAGQFAALDNLRAEMETEDLDLAVAERALDRLVTLRSREAPSRIPWPSSLERRGLNRAWSVLQMAALIALVAAMWLSVQRSLAGRARAAVIQRSAVIGPSIKDKQPLGDTGMTSQQGRAIEHRRQGPRTPETASVPYAYGRIMVLSDDELEAISQARAADN